MKRRVVKRKKAEPLASRVVISPSADFFVVRFKLREGDKEFIECTILKNDSGRLLVRAGKMLHIQPDMANSLTLRCDGKDFR